MTKRGLVACFHGGGSNNEVFSTQCIRLQQLVKNEMEFVFFEGPFERAAGPGVLPIFEDYGPFRNWFKVYDGPEIGDGSGWDAAGTNGVERTWKLLEKRAPKEEWMGVLGFSQGTRMASGLLLDQQRRAARNDSNGFDLRFGILCNGVNPPMETIKKESTNGESSHADSELITIPTVHFHGLVDEFLESSRKQKATYFSPKTSTLREINYHHAMPWAKDDLALLADESKKLYKSTCE